MPTELQEIESELAEIRRRQRSRGVKPIYDEYDTDEEIDASPYLGAALETVGTVASAGPGLIRYAGTAMRAIAGPTELAVGLQKAGKAGSEAIELAKEQSPSVRAFRKETADTGLFEKLPLKILGGIGPTAAGAGLSFAGPVGIVVATAQFLGLNTNSQIEELERRGVDPDKANGLVATMAPVLSVMDRLGLRGINLPKLPITNKLISGFLGYAIASGSEGLTEPVQTLAARLVAERAANPDENMVQYSNRMMKIIPELSDGLAQEAVVAALTGGAVKFGADVTGLAKSFRTREAPKPVKPPAAPTEAPTEAPTASNVEPEAEESMPPDLALAEETSPITQGLKRLKWIEEDIAKERGVIERYEASESERIAAEEVKDESEREARAVEAERLRSERLTARETETLAGLSRAIESGIERRENRKGLMFDFVGKQRDAQTKAFDTERAASKAKEEEDYLDSIKKEIEAAVTKDLFAVTAEIEASEHLAHADKAVDTAFRAVKEQQQAAASQETEPFNFRGYTFRDRKQQRAAASQETEATTGSVPRGTSTQVVEGEVAPPVATDEGESLSQVGGKVLSAAGSAVSEVAKGATELFGGGRALMSFPAGMNQETYAKAKPHFIAAFQATIQAGQSIKEFIKLASEKVGRKLRPYIKYFIEENRDIFPDLPKTRVQQRKEKVEALKKKVRQDKETAKEKAQEKLSDLKVRLADQKESARARLEDNIAKETDKRIKVKARLDERIAREKAKVEQVKEAAASKSEQSKEAALNKSVTYKSDRKMLIEAMQSHFSGRAAKGLEVRRQIVEHAKRYLPPEEQGRVLAMVAKAQTDFDLKRAYIRIDSITERSMRIEAEKEIREFGVRIKDRQGVTPGVRAAIASMVSDIPAESKGQAIKNLHSIKDEMGHEYARVLNILTRKSFKEMTFGELATTRDALLWLEKRGAKYYKTFNQLHADKVDGVVKSIIGGMTAIDSSNADRLGIVGAPMNVLFDRQDGSKGTYDGLVFMAIKEPLDIDNGNAINETMKLHAAVLEKADELGLSNDNFDRIGIYAAAKQSAAGGIEKLENSGYKKKEIEAIVSSMTEEEIKFYDYVRGVYEAIFPRVEAAVLDIDGRVVNGEEFYSPLRTDYEKLKVADPGAKVLDIIAGGHNFDPLAGKVKDDATRDRTGAGKQPIRVDFMGLAMEHITNSMFLIHVGRRVKFNHDIIHHREFVKAAGEYGAEYLSKWSDTVARNGGVSSGVVRWMDWIRRNFGIATLGAKVGTVAIQLSSLPLAVPFVGGSNLIEGVHKISTSGEWRNFVDENMPEIKARFVDDIAYKEMLEGKKLLNSVWIKHAAVKSFVPLKKMDWFSAASVGVAAYIDYMNKHNMVVDMLNPNLAATLHAQKVVGRTQASMQVKDMPLWFSRGDMAEGGENSRSVARFVGQLQNFTTNMWSLIRHDMIRSGLSTGDVKHSASIAIWTTASMMATLGLRDLSNMMLRFGSDPPEEEDSFLEKLFFESLSINPVASIGVSTFKYERFPIPGLSPIPKLGKGFAKATQAKQTETRQRGASEMVESVGQIIGVPAAVQINQLVRQHVIGHTIEQLQEEKRQIVKGGNLREIDRELRQKYINRQKDIFEKKKRRDQEKTRS